MNSIYALLGPHKRGFFLLVFLLTILAFVEIATLSAVPFYLAILLHGNIGSELIGQYQADIYKAFDFKNIVIYGSLILALVFGIKNLFSGFVNYYESIFLSDLSLYLEESVVSTYLNLEYINHKTKDSATFINDATKGVEGTQTFYRSIIYLVREMMTSFALIGLLIYIDFKITIFTFVLLGSIGVLFYTAVRKKIKAIGAMSHDYNAREVKVIRNCAKGIKESILYKRQEFFASKVSLVAQKKYELIATQQFLMTIPRLLFETVAMIAVFVMVFILQDGKKNIEQIVPTLSLFAFSFMRMIPALNAISMAVGNIKYFSVFFKSIYKFIYSSGKKL